MIEWNQEARSYSLVDILSRRPPTLLLLRALQRPTVLRCLTYGLVAGIGLYAHSFVGARRCGHTQRLRPPHTVVASPRARSWPQPSRSPSLPCRSPFLYTEYGSAYGWIDPLTLTSIRYVLTELIGGLPLLVALVALGGLAAVSHRADRRVWLILAAAVVPLIAAIVISVFRPVLVGRYLVVSLPFIAVLAGVGLASIRPVVWCVAAVGMLSFLLVLALPWAYRDNHQQDWRAASEWIASSAQPGDAFVATPWGRRELGYYMERVENGTVPNAIGTRKALTREPGDRVWVVLANLSDQQKEEAIERLSDGFESEARQFGSRWRSCS